VRTQKNVIEINGKKYDAATGELLGDSASKSRQQAGGGSMDGMTSSKNSPALPPSVVRERAAHAQKSMQKSQTLMRSAVKKPTSVPEKTPPESKSELGASRARHLNATKTKKSPHVNRYAAKSSHRSTIITKVQPLQVQQQPNQSNQAATQPQAATLQQGKPMSPAAKMIEQSLANATAHEHPRGKAPKKRSKFGKKFGVSARAIGISSTVLAGVLLGGFFAIQNVPNLSMRVASARAGFNAEMPAYSPSGFSFSGPINYSPGQVKVSFSSNTDDRSYDVTQRASNWNSSALLSNYILGKDKQYQTYIDKGRTLYIYDGSSATWVDNGVWYQIEGESQMTTDQLVRIASSI